MDTRKRSGFYIVVFALLLVGLACELSSTQTPLPATQTPKIQVVTATRPGIEPTAPVAGATPAVIDPMTAAPGGENLSSAQKQQLARATVRVAIMQKSGGKLVVIGFGSGTILTKDGLILTNCHVADPIAMGLPEDEAPDALVIELVESEDHPPVSTYIAKLIVSDPTLDLAVIRVDKKLDGSPVDLASLNLPFVKIGNSDEMKFGDPLYVFGFPGIGGQTITYTTGNVSGFDSMDPIGNRAWIKTDATIAGGNSGGLASNTRAEIIGVPTRLGTSSATKMTDCRFIADTNGDGKIDDKDTCVPTGGFINAIRPINWAKGLIDAGLNQVAYTSPYNPAKPSPTKAAPPQTTAAKFVLNGWATTIDANNCPTQTVQSFESGATKIFSVFKFSFMVKGSAWSYRWMVDDRDVYSNQDTWKKSDAGQCFSFSLDNQGKALPDGNYKLEIFTGAKQDLSGSATTRIGGMKASSNGVQVTGKTVDANTGNGIGGVYIILLQPGIDPDEWLNNNGSDDDVASLTQSTDTGDFVLPDLLARGESYGAVVGNTKLGYQTLTGFIDIENDDPDVIKLMLELTK